MPLNYTNLRKVFQDVLIGHVLLDASDKDPLDGEAGLLSSPLSLHLSHEDYKSIATSPT